MKRILAATLGLLFSVRAGAETRVRFVHNLGNKLYAAQRELDLAVLARNCYDLLEPAV